MGEQGYFLRPLPETGVAVLSLRGLGVVAADLPQGWAPAGLAFAIASLASRPGQSIRLWEEGGVFRTAVSGGSSATADGDIDEMFLDWLFDDVTVRTCQLCGRPGQPSQKRVAVLCDFCEHLLLTNDAAAPFPPRLPLFDSAASAQLELIDRGILAWVPAGWARVALRTFERLDDVRLIQKAIFSDKGDHLAIDISGGGGIVAFDQIRSDLEDSTRARCRHCGRWSSPTATVPGQCEGCTAIQARGWEIIRARNGGEVGR
ncbi:hypothetical protein [Leifsonia sp. NPDC058230]|uniref:hypothetical protein n=1 Tax=Leifsonia sp. NPDC058230 TaxID=3346391 RepID=UPI0036DED448